MSTEQEKQVGHDQQKTRNIDGFGGCGPIALLDTC